MPQENWTKNTSPDHLTKEAQPQQQTTSLVDRGIIASSLTSLKLQIDTTIRLLQQPDKPVYITDLEKLVLKMSTCADNILNRRINDI